MSENMLEKIIKDAIESNASDIHLTKGLPPTLRIYKELIFQDRKELTNSDIKNIVEKLLPNGAQSKYNQTKYIDSSFEYASYRFRVHIYRQSSSDAVTLRLIPTKIPLIEELNIPTVLKQFTTLRNGLVLITGITGSGKSTTLAALIGEINSNQKKHIITVEDPIEFVHKHKNSIITQKEIGNDVTSFAEAVRSAVREDPDVLLVGEMRDLETIQNTITMAETGHLVFATLHTRNVAETIDRIIDVFQPSQQQQIRMQLSSVIEGIVSQHLVPKIDGGIVPACEVMIATDAIRNLIREQNPPNSILDQIQMNHKKLGSQTYIQSLATLYNKKLISYETAIQNTDNGEELKKMIMSV